MSKKGKMVRVEYKFRLLLLYCLNSEIPGLDISYRLYKNGRHEILNESNRDEVERDLITWLNGQLPDNSANTTAALSL
jgi:hypothetical protein